jgi:hypothetical protein
MPRYYFHFQDGPARLTDSEGVALPDPEAAWYQGVRAVRDIIEGDLCAGAFRPDRTLEITDEGGFEVWAVPFEDLMNLTV